VSAENSLGGTRDPRTGHRFFPPRALSVDGSLTDLVPVELAAAGRLAEFVALGEKWFGYVDLDEDIRLITELGPGPHEVGATYVLNETLLNEPGSSRRFDHA
jgi:uncharacterized OB-fold protein